MTYCRTGATPKGQAGNATLTPLRIGTLTRCHACVAPRGPRHARVPNWRIYVDIEERKRGEDAMRARETSWRQIVDNIPGFVATMGPMGEVEFLNRQTLELFR